MKFVLSAGDDDSILAAKVFVAANPGCVHLSSGRKSRDLPKGSELVFVRPYLGLLDFIGTNGYCKDFKVTLYQYENTELFEERGRLAEAGCACHWIDNNSSFCTTMWEVLHGNMEYPDIVKFTHDYMKWELQFEESVYLHYGMSIQPSRFTAESTEYYLKLISGDEALMNRVLQDGTDIRLYVDHTYHLLAQELIFESELGEYSVLCANAPGVNSFFFMQRPNATDYDMAMSFSLDCSNGNVRHTLFRINPEVSVQPVAKSLGGNGNPGVAGFVSKELEVKFTRSAIADGYDYSQLFGPEELSDAVRRFIHLNFIVKRYNVQSAMYKGKRAFVANTPYLARENIFGNINRYDEELGVSFCMTANHNYRVAVINIDGSDPGEVYGTKVGNYRISVVPFIEGLESENVNSEAF